MTPPTNKDPVSMGWTKSLPAGQNIYWHWNGDPDCGPVPISVLKSLTDDCCFVSAGQWGWDRPESCHDVGGWWMKCEIPPTPDVFCP